MTATPAPTKRRGNALFIAATAVILAFLGVSFAMLAIDGRPMSTFDEQVHFDTSVKLAEGEYPYRGAPYSERVAQEWACGVGHEVAPLAHECGDPELSPSDVGEYTSGYIHYPTYFMGAVGMHRLLSAVSDSPLDLDSYRLFSAVMMWLGLVTSAIFAYLLGLRRWGLIAAATLPAAATGIMVMAVMVTPNSTSLLMGALIAGTGLLWIKRGRGFVWLALSVALGAATAVVNSLPAGGFILLIAAVAIAQRRGWTTSTGWQPRFWQAVVLGLIVLAPVVAWSRYIAATATATNAEVYGQFQATDWRFIAVGAVRELFAFHSPWNAWIHGLPSRGTFFSVPFRAAADGIPQWITIIVVGAIVLVLLRVLVRQRVHQQGLQPTPELSAVSHKVMSPYYGLALTTMITIVLYPVALRVSNSITFGIDYPIVDRYSMAFAPLLVLLALTLVPNRVFAITLAALGVFGTVTLASTWL